MKRYFSGRYLRAARRLWRDEDGIVLPYVTIVMVAIIGLSGLALDASRFRSLKTQMQAGADALALAGARELDGSNGSITRATNAINNMISNTPQGMGTQSKITAATITFYSSLYAATDSRIGVVTTNSNAAKYVGVTVSPASLGTILPVGFTSLSADAMAVAGYDFAVCNMPPVFICNPYEQAGDDEATANNRWMTQVNLPANQQQLTRLTVNGGSGYGPGHFGFLVPPDNCNGASCLIDWIARKNPSACYRKKMVDLNTGQMQSVFDAFNVRFDMYSGSIKASANYAPATNVRKGYLPGSGKGGACNPIEQNLVAPNPSYGVIVPQVTINGTVDSKDTTLITTTSTPGGPLYVGSMVSDANGYVTAGTTIQSISGTLVTLSVGVKNSQKGKAITIVAGGPDQYANAQANAVPLPLDLNMVGNTVSPGNGQWDCQDYWKIVHGTTPPTGCGEGTTSNPTTLSRYSIYQMESALLNDAAGPGAPAGGGEVGGPTCNPPGVATDDGGGDRRVIYAAIINCIGNAGSMTGGQTADNIPVAGFGKFFMTQPADTSNQALIGEMTGAVGLDKNAKNNVQLYR
ncbi:MAG: pilus assembly protein TadG-related protein [Xanthobacteraceae bacterium]